MKKTTKKRFDTANQIRDEIERHKARAIKLTANAEVLEKEVEFLRNRNDPKLVELIGFKREQAKRFRVSARRIYDKTLYRLKEKMAEFLTDPLPGMGAGKDIQR